ncbi:hypothetical protein GCM10009555_061700 [Acrocarpospora macrocephala]
MIFTLVEPHPGHHEEFLAWYRDDHFYGGAMAGPGVVAGRRWSAPGRGSFLGTFFLAEGYLEEYERWSATTHPDLARRGRMFAARDHVHRGRYRLREPAPRRAIAALDTPYEALLVTLWAGEPHHPAEGLALAFEPHGSTVSELVPAGDHLLLLTFLNSPPEQPPDALWSRVFTPSRD